MATRVRLYPNQAEIAETQGCEQTEINDRPTLMFDGANNERCYWTFVIPESWKVSPQVAHAYVFYGMVSASVGTVNVDIYIESISPGDAVNLYSGSSFDVINSQDDITVPGTAGHMNMVDVTLTNHDNSDAGDLARLWLERDAINDTALGDMVVYAVEIQDSA